MLTGLAVVPNTVQRRHCHGIGLNRFEHVELFAGEGDEKLAASSADDPVGTEKRTGNQLEEGNVHCGPLPS